MTSALGRATGRWARCGDALFQNSATGAVVLPPADRAVVTLSPVERAVWAALDEPATTDALVASGDGPAVRAALDRLAALGVVREVD